jgi:hypothetical protein
LTPNGNCGTIRRTDPIELIVLWRGLVFKFLNFISAALFLTASICQAQTLPTEKIAYSEVQNLPSCIASWGHPKPGQTGDCFCRAYPNETGRYFATIANKQVLVVSFQTDPVASGGPNGMERGCWNLTDFKFPPGYTLAAYQFQTSTGSGPCYRAWDSLTGNIPSRAYGQALVDQNWQQCQEYPRGPIPTSDLEFKFLMGWHEAGKGFVPATAMMGRGGINPLEMQYANRDFGSASITLYLVAK